MKILFTFLVLITTSLTVSADEPNWVDDILIWDMTYNSTWLGFGYTYCDGMYDSDGIMYSVSIIDSTGATGDVLKIFSSDDNGANWIKENWATGGSINMVDPEISIVRDISGTEHMIIYLAGHSDNIGQPYGLKYELPSFTFEDFIQVDYSHASADTIRSIAVVYDYAVDTTTEWVIADDVSNNLFLTSSNDCGATWSPSILIAEDAARPSAAIGPGDRIYIAYQETVGESAIKCIAIGATDTVTTTIGTAAPDAAPVPAAEWSGDLDIAVAYHDASSNIMMTLSHDDGLTWDLPQAIASGYYPFIDVFPDSRLCAMAFVDQNTSLIKVSQSQGLAGILSSSPSTRSDYAPSLAGPAIVRHGPQPGKIGLWYMGPGPQDLWHDNSYLTSCPEPESSGYSFRVFPNPAKAGFYANINLPVADSFELGIYSLDGRLVERVFAGFSQNEELFIGSSLPTGIYCVVLRTGNSVESQKIIKL